MTIPTDKNDKKISASYILMSQLKTRLLNTHYYNAEKNKIQFNHQWTGIMPYVYDFNY